MDITTKMIAAAMGKGWDVAWALSLVCAKSCGKPQKHWCHDACGVAVALLKRVVAHRGNAEAEQLWHGSGNLKHIEIWTFCGAASQIFFFTAL